MNSLLSGDSFDNKSIKVKDPNLSSRKMIRSCVYALVKTATAKGGVAGPNSQFVMVDCSCFIGQLL